MEGLKESLDVLWLVLCAILVILMQAGFVCIESGLVRAKNSIHVAGKNVVDFCIASLVFWLTGFGIMFGATYYGIYGTSMFAFSNLESGWLSAFFLFQMAFCGVAATIVSGAVAERMRFSGYMVTSIILSGVIYPVAGHWAWAGTIANTEAGFLGAMGFIDFAGATVVHSVGGWFALAALIIIGPRIGRFGPGNRPIEGSDLPKAGLGLLLLWIGWFGFTGGSLPTFSVNLIPTIMINTVLGGAGGGIMALILSRILTGRPNVVRSINATVAGLVSISASAYMISPGDAFLIGGIGGAICYAATHYMIYEKIDDATGAVPAHLFAGIWGTLAVAIFPDPENFLTGLTRFEQLRVQLLGIIMIGAYSFFVGYLFLSLVDRLFKLRVDPNAEKIGLNIAEHGASTAINNLLQAMEHQRQGGDWSKVVEVEPATEAGQIAAQYNLVVDKFNTETIKREEAVKEMRRAKEVAETANRTKSRFLANVSHELRTPLNAIMGFSEAIQTQILGEVGNKRYVEYADHIFNSGQHLLTLIKDILDLSKMEEGRFDLFDEAVDIGEILKRVTAFLHFELPKNNLKLDIQIAENFPKLKADKRAVTQILTNLLSNAVKFSKPDTTIKVNIALRPDRGIRLQVQDQGIGIAPENLERAMEPFIQVDSEVARRFKGTGLGLPITKSLVELHGGTLHLESVVDKGTTVTIDMPPSRTLDS
ncbi:MAG: ammonium transporter [Dongiaceae bacterium]